jgi:hypothetical protein
MNAGSHSPPDYAYIQSGKVSPRDHILRGHGRGVWDDPAPFFKSPAAEGLLAKIDELSAPPPGAAFDDGVARCEMWNAEQRQSKYIINSVRTYEFAGARWRTLWDYEFIDFFLRVPVELRFGQKLFLDCIRDRIFVDDLAGLGRIPLVKRGPLKALSEIQSPAQTSTVGRWMQAMKRRARLQLLKAGVARGRIGKLPPMQATRSRLAGLEIPSGPITFERALAHLGALEWLAPEIRQALRPWLGFKLDSLRFRTVYTTLMLSEMTKDFHSRRGDVQTI